MRLYPAISVLVHHKFITLAPDYRLEDKGLCLSFIVISEFRPFKELCICLQILPIRDDAFKLHRVFLKVHYHLIALDRLVPDTRDMNVHVRVEEVCCIDDADNLYLFSFYRVNNISLGILIRAEILVVYNNRGNSDGTINHLKDSFFLCHQLSLVLNQEGKEFFLCRKFLISVSYHSLTFLPVLCPLPASALASAVS